MIVFRGFLIVNRFQSYSYKVCCQFVNRKYSTAMSHPKRYFINSFADYTGGEVKIPTDVLKQRCLSYVNLIFERQGLSFDDCDGGLYVGVGGIAYMCYHLSQHQHFQKESQQLLAEGEKYLKHALNYTEHPKVKSDKSVQVAFLLGASGVYSTAAVIMDAIGKKNECDFHLSRYASLADMCLPINFLRCGSDELFVGRAGYLCGLLFLKKKFGNEIIPREKIFQLCQAVIESGKEYSKKRKSPSPLMYAYYGTEYLGAAHGLCAILQMLLSFPDYLDSYPEAERNVKGAVDFLLSLQTASGNFPCAMDEVVHQRPEQDELVHWCHGAAGVVYLMAKAYLRWKDSRYLQSCLSCGEIVWRKGLLRKGPGICHGVAGSGYVFLLLYRLTGDAKHLHRAIQFANFMFTEEFSKARTPDRPLSLYEGIAGTVCLLADLMQPEQAHFPFFDVI